MAVAKPLQQIVQDQNLTRGSIPRHIRNIAVPASVGFFFHTMYNVVDTYFAGVIDTEALAALSLSFPVFFILIAVGQGMSTGATALIGQALGAEDRATASRYALHAVGFGVLLSGLIALVGLQASPYLFGVMGAEGAYLERCLAYMDIIFYGAPAFMLVFMTNSALQAVGDTRSNRNFLIAGTFLNIGLDPWFIFGGMGIPAMGIAGVAVATVLIQALGAVYLWTKATRTGLLTPTGWRSFVPDPRVYADIAHQGFPASFNFMTIGMGIFVINYFVSQFGKEAVAAYGAAMRVEQIVLMPTIGLNTATLALVAQNAGAGQFERVKEAIAKSMLYGGACMMVGTVGVLAAAGPLMGLFTDDPRVVDMGVTYLWIDAFVFYAYVILFMSVAALQGMKRPLFAVWIGLFRQIAAPWAVFYLLVFVWDLGLVSIWWGIFGICWFSAFVSAAYMRFKVARLEGAL